MKALRISASTLKILAGIVFLFSAVAKFVTIDAFEMYIYSFGLFPMVMCFYLARIVLALELILGASLISHRNHRFTVLMALLFLICFIVFLTYAHLVGRTDNCHCFGDLIPFNPVQSIFKNAILVLALVYIFKFAPQDWHPRWWLVVLIYIATGVLFYFYMTRIHHVLDLLAMVMMFAMLCVGVLASMSFYNKWYVTTALILTPIVTTFTLTPPDSWFYTGNDERYDAELFRQQITAVDESIQDSVAAPELSNLGLDRGRQIVAFFSPKCGYCRLAAEKIATIVDRYNLDSENITYIFPEVRDSASYDLFYEDSRSPRFNEVHIDKELFIHITRAAFPIVLLVEDGETTASYAYRNINEGAIRSFLEVKH